jgi:hypothetical protein
VKTKVRHFVHEFSFCAKCFPTTVVHITRKKTGSPHALLLAPLGAKQGWQEGEIETVKPKPATTSYLTHVEHSTVKQGNFEHENMIKLKLKICTDDFLYFFQL